MKVFYNRHNKKEYNAHFRQHDVYHINIIVIKDIIISEKSKKKKKKSVEENVDKIAMVMVTKILSSVDFNGRYMWTISNIDIDTTKDLGLIDIKKY